MPSRSAVQRSAPVEAARAPERACMVRVRRACRPSDQLGDEPGAVRAEQQAVRPVTGAHERVLPTRQRPSTGASSALTGRSPARTSTNVASASPGARRSISESSWRIPAAVGRASNPASGSTRRADHHPPSGHGTTYWLRIGETIGHVAVSTPSHRRCTIWPRTGATGIVVPRRVGERRGPGATGDHHRVAARSPHPRRSTAVTRSAAVTSSSTEPSTTVSPAATAASSSAAVMDRPSTAGRSPAVPRRADLAERREAAPAPRSTGHLLDVSAVAGPCQGDVVAEELVLPLPERDPQQPGDRVPGVARVHRPRARARASGSARPRRSRARTSSDPRRSPTPATGSRPPRRSRDRDRAGRRRRCARPPGRARSRAQCRRAPRRRRRRRSPTGALTIAGGRLGVAVAGGLRAARRACSGRRRSRGSRRTSRTR